MKVKITMKETVTFYADAKSLDALENYINNHTPHEAYDNVVFSRTKYNGLTADFEDDYTIVPEDKKCDFIIE